MSGSQPANPPSSSTWTEPPWCGWIETTGDALLILEAARRGLIPRVTRRLVDAERKMITSGSVFVFDEDESGIKRWTDGFFWSPSRILGNFLLYRETDKRGSTGRGKGAESPNEGDSSKDSHTLSRPKADTAPIMDKARERSLLGSLTNSYKFKPDGLMKKTFSLTIGGVAQHLISYYKVEDVASGRLRSPSSLPELAALDISPEYLDKTHFRNPPKVELGPDGILRYRGEADDIDGSPPLLTAPLSGLPLLTDGRVTDASANATKRTKRYDPYTSPVAKRPRKQTKNSSDEASSSTEHRLSPEAMTSPPQSSAGYPESNSAGPAPPASYPTYGMPTYYQVPGYPHIFPPSSGPYPPNAPHILPPQPIMTSAQHPAQPVPVPPSHTTNDSTPVTPAQQYYSYYPPPHPSYTGYPGVAWPYAGYPPHPVPQMHPPPPMRDDRTDDGKEDSPDLET
ncbi:Gti1/Pac2 family domain containing protein [Amanita muscaria]